MKYIFAMLTCSLMLSYCQHVKTVNVMPLSAWPELRSYGGIPSLAYPDTALKRLNEFIRPMGYYAAFKSGCLTCCSKDTVLSLTPLQYRAKRLDKDAREIYKAVFGDRKHPNKYARLSVILFILRVDFAADYSDNSLYSIDFWYSDYDPLFSDLTPF
jgi:hypothetical protein